jgi:hypothetical protein
MPKSQYYDLRPVDFAPLFFKRIALIYFFLYFNLFSAVFV